MHISKTTAAIIGEGHHSRFTNNPPVLYYKFSQLSPSAKQTAASEYLKGWQEDHPDEDTYSSAQGASGGHSGPHAVSPLAFAYEMCMDTDDDYLYTADGQEVDDDPENPVNPVNKPLPSRN